MSHPDPLLRRVRGARPALLLLLLLQYNDVCWVGGLKDWEGVDKIFPKGRMTFSGVCGCAQLKLGCVHVATHNSSPLQSGVGTIKSRFTPLCIHQRADWSRLCLGGLSFSL